MRQIIAGSTGFSINPRNPHFDRYVLAQSKVQVPRICFIPTASGDSRNYIRRFYRFFDKETCEPSHLELFKGNFADLRSFLRGKDILYVGGGNTRNMLCLLFPDSFDQIVW